MAAEAKARVTMRIRLGDAELEVSGPQAFVEGKIAEFVARQKELTAAATGAAVGTPAGKTQAKAASIVQLFKKAKPQADVDRVLLAGYYLEKGRDLDSFTAAEVRDAVRDAKTRPPRNPNDAINSNIRKGLMMTAGDKEGRLAFVLTTDGEEHVDELIGQ